MLTILKLFGKSPFAPLQSHMEKVAECVHLLPELFLSIGDAARIESLAKKISELEHQADLTKNNIRNHLPKSLFLPMDRESLLEILGIQDDIADKAEDISVLISIKPLAIPDSCKEDFNLFLAKNIESFDEVFLIIKELHELLESSFGGIEAEKVNRMVESVAFKEHEADLIQRRLLKDLFCNDKGISFADFLLLQRLFEAVGSLSNLSEKLANRIRMTLELK